MISVVIPTLQSEMYISQILISLMPAILNGLITEVIVSDGGSVDDTFKICDAMGATFIEGATGRGAQLAAGAKAAKGEWLLFLHADTDLEPDWEKAVAAFIHKIERQGRQNDKAAYFRFQLDDSGVTPYLVRHFVRLRCALLGMPYGDQGLLIAKGLYQDIGGYQPLPIMEDVDIIEKIGRKRLQQLPVAAITSAERYQKEGYFFRVMRNFLCIVFYKFGVPLQKIAQFYEGNSDKKRSSHEITEE